MPAVDEENKFLSGEIVANEPNAACCLINELVRQRLRVANALGCYTHEIEAEVERLAAMLPRCRDCGRLATSQVCGSCLEDRRRVA